jgi:prepilin-type N-terminal cleavage/methylation domain-containing protein
MVCSNIMRPIGDSLEHGAGGYTLIELLVTIAVIVILASLLLVAVSTVKRKAQQAKCVGNLRQLGMATILYSQENNGKPPGRRHPDYPDGDWMGTLRDYYKIDDLRVCPTAPLRPPHPTPKRTNGQGTADKAWVRWTRDGKTMFYGSYGYNGWFYDSNNPRDGFAIFWLENEMKVDAPTTTPVFFDANWNAAWPHSFHRPVPNLYAGQALDVKTNSMARLIVSRHGSGSGAKAPRKISANDQLPGGINLAAYDGHVEYAPLEKLWNYTWHRGWQPVPRPKPIDQ